MSWLNETRNWCIDFEASWNKLPEDSRFSEFSCQELKKRNWVEGFDLDKLMEDFLIQVYELKQLNPKSLFGSPALTLFYSKKGDFVLDLYVWNESHTSIHSHSFEGCFHILQGISLEASYTFTPSLEIESPWGKLTPQSLKIMNAGDTGVIELDRGLIHKVLHLSKPSVSLALRTTPHHAARQMTYNFGCLSSPSFPESSVLTKLKILEWYFSQNKINDSLIKDLLNYREMWELILSRPELKDYFFKLTFATDKTPVIFGFLKERTFRILLNQLSSPQEMMLLTAFEFFDEKKWKDWVSQNLEMAEGEIEVTLKRSLSKTEFAKTNELESDILLRSLY